jgi:DNA-binding transcriptional MocR family regulator
MNLSHALENIRPSYIREILSDAKSPGVISLAGGLPATDLLPIDLFAKAIKPLADVPELFQYGETPGYEPLLNYIRESSDFSLCGHESIIYNGSQQGLDLVARAFLNPGDNIVVEAPSYLGALQVFG